MKKLQDFKNYNDSLTASLFHFNKYNKWSKIIADIFLVLTFFLSFTLIILLLVDGTFKDPSNLTVMSFFHHFNEPLIKICSFSFCFSSFSFVLFLNIHRYLLKSQMKTFKESLMQNLISSYSKMFSDIQAMDNLKKEKDKTTIVLSLQKQQQCIEFNINHYNDFFESN